MKKGRTPKQLIWAENTAREVRVTAVGGARALVENHLGLLSYAPERVRVRSHRGAVNVCGQGLALREVREGALIVSGRIDCVEIEHDPSAG